jgi:hypothetical protein
MIREQNKPFTICTKFNFCFNLKKMERQRGEIARGVRERGEIARRERER